MFVDMSKSFKDHGWEYCRYLITDPRSDSYLRQRDIQDISKYDTVNKSIDCNSS